MALLEARPYRPFKSSEEYLEAMKEDLAEWLSTLYPELLINAENFMDRLDTGVALCKHANYVRQAAEDYLARRQARNKSMTRSMTSGLAGPILALGNVHYLPAAKSGTFFARDNVSNFITWCRKSLKIIECLLFETDDLIMRKNEKHVILCLLEVARRGAKFGMLAPMLVQMERQIDREIAAENKANGIGCGTQTDQNSSATQTTEIGVGTDAATETGDIFDTDSENDENDDGPMLMYGPQPQIITNDLKSLDEMVRDLVEKCTCPSQFPMVRVSEGKYRIGDTKVLIFVRILRSHVMVRVGGGWDTLSHYLDKHDPCRCRAQHRMAVAARLIPRSNNQTNGIELHKAQVIFDRSPPSTRKLISSFNSQINQATLSQQSSTTASPMSSNNTTPTHASVSNNRLSPSYGSKNRSRSPTPQRKYLNQFSSNNTTTTAEQSSNSTKLVRRSVSPSPRRLADIKRKQKSLDSSSGPKSLPPMENHVQFDSLNLSQTEGSGAGNVNANSNNNGTSTDTHTSGNKFENISDNGSEISDEGYRSLGVIQSNAQKRESLHSQASTEDAENNARLDQSSSDSQSSPVEENPLPLKTLEVLEADYTDSEINITGPQSLPAILSISTPSSSPPPALTPTSTPVEELQENTFEQSGVFITDDDITVDVANSTGLRKTNYSNKIFGGEDVQPAVENIVSVPNTESKIPRSPQPERRRSVDSGSMQDLSARTGLPVFNRTKPVYRSVRKPVSVAQKDQNVSSMNTTVRRKTPVTQEPTNTWSGRSSSLARKRASVNAQTFTPTASPVANGTSSAFERNSKIRSSHILYDSNGRRVRSGYVPASLNTSPTKQASSSSPLAQQLLEAASCAKNDAQILEKMKALLSRYAASNQMPGTKSAGKKAIYEDFTSAWVHSNGNLERSSSCSPPTKTLSKRSSAASSTESTHSRDMSVIVSPRRDRGLSKIPAPVRQHTELY